MNSHLWKFKCKFWFSLAIFVITPELFASEYRLGIYSQTLTSFYEDERGESAIPFSQQLIFQSPIGFWHGSFTTNMRFNQNLNDDNDRFDLYQGELELHDIVDKVDLRFGRLTVTEGIDYLLVDGGAGTVRLAQNFENSFFAGWRRDTWLGKDLNTGVLAGTTFYYTPLAALKSRIALLVEENDNEVADQRLGVGANYALVWPIRTSLNGNVEFSFAGGGIANLFINNTWYITPRHNLLVGYRYRDPLIGYHPEHDEIYRLFAHSGTHSFTTELYLQIGRFLVAKPVYELNGYRANDQEIKITHQLSLALLLLKTASGFESSASYTFMHNYAGMSQRFAGSISQKITSTLNLSLGTDLLQYDKYTNESAVASRVYSEGRWQINNLIAITPQATLSSNELVEQEWRALLMVEIQTGRIL